MLLYCLRPIFLKQVSWLKIVDGLVKAIPHEPSPFKVMTVSAGVSCVSNKGKIYDHWEQTVDQADKALYRQR